LDAERGSNTDAGTHAPARFGKDRQFGHFVGYGPRLIEGLLLSLRVGRVGDGVLSMVFGAERD